MDEIKKICSDLCLPAGDDFMQDWAYELPDEYRTEEWLGKYIYAYLNNHYSLRGKKELMALSLDVSNDLLSSGTLSIKGVISDVLSVLFENHRDYSDLIDYWSLENEPLEDGFALTPEVRLLKERLK